MWGIIFKVTNKKDCYMSEIKRDLNVISKKLNKYTTILSKIPIPKIFSQCFPFFIKHQALAWSTIYNRSIVFCY